MKPEDQSAAEAAREWLLRLRQWQGFDLTEYQQTSLIEAFQSAIEKATKELQAKLDLTDGAYAELERQFIEGQSRTAHASEPQYDPSLTVPPEIMEAAEKVAHWATMNGFKRGWCIGPVADRAAHASEQLYKMEVIEKPWGREKVFTPAHASEQGADTERLNWLHHKAMGSSIHMTLDQLLGTDRWTDLRSAIDKARNS